MPLIILNIRRLNWWNSCAGVLLLTIFFNEYLVYTLQRWQWMEFPKSAHRQHDLVMLLVADPQIPGYTREPPLFLGTLSRWDADRYLRNNFHLTLGYLRPDVIVFLGDLLDEGSIARDRDFADYKERFDNIFTTSTDIPKIIIAGDNDVGGEFGEFRSDAKDERFVEHFGPLTGTERVSFVDFIKMDIQHSRYTQKMREDVRRIAGHLSSPYRVMLNHMSVLLQLKPHVHPILKELRPHLIISAHWHESKHFVCDDCMSHKADTEMEYWPVYVRELKNEIVPITVDLNNAEAVNELMVPSCSYRMKEPSIGFGVVVINDTGVAHYGVLWLPRRYILFYVYGFVICTLLVLFFLRKLFYARPKS